MYPPLASTGSFIDRSCEGTGGIDYICPPNPPTIVLMFSYGHRRLDPVSSAVLPSLPLVIISHSPKNIGSQSVTSLDGVVFRRKSQKLDIGKLVITSLNGT